MNKTQLIALLNKWGVTVPADATDEHILNLVEAGPPGPGRSIASPETTSRIRNLLSKVNGLLDSKFPIDDPASEDAINMNRIEIGLSLSELQGELNSIWDR